MRVYVETNFVLELALEQGAHEVCAALLGDARRRALALVVPGFSLFEAHHALVGKHRRRERLIEELRREAHEFHRSREFSGLRGDSDVLLAELTRSIDHAESSLRRWSEELVAVAEILPLDAQVMASALQIVREGTLPLPDAMVLATIRRDPRLGVEPACFVTTNRADFSDPTIVDELARQSCKILYRFDAALAYARAEPPA